MPSAKLHQFVNCMILRDHKLVNEDLWVRAGKFINPQNVFYDEKVKADEKIDCKGAIIAAGFIDIQINGAFGIDFSFNTDNVEDGLQLVSKGLLEHGVTSFCPTIVTSPKEVYHTILPKIRKRTGGKHGATVLGVHVEGPFINLEKKGAHPQQFVQDFSEGYNALVKTYGSLENVKIVTLAPELPNSSSVIKELVARDVCVAVGHSMGNLKDGEEAVRSGATLITHLFNAMLPFHHRDPGLVGLLASRKIPKDKIIYFGIIADGIHTHPSALRIAHRTNSEGLILVTDAISAMGLEEGKHNIGQLAVEIRERRAYIAGTNTLCGSIANMNQCVKLFKEATGCSIEYALEAASLHPAMALGVSDVKGTLNFESDADFVMLDEFLNVRSTWIAGECVFPKEQLASYKSL